MWAQKSEEYNYKQKRDNNYGIKNIKIIMMKINEESNKEKIKNKIYIYIYISKRKSQVYVSQFLKVFESKYPSPMCHQGKSWAMSHWAVRSPNRCARMVMKIRSRKKAEQEWSELRNKSIRRDNPRSVQLPRLAFFVVICLSRMYGTWPLRPVTVTWAMYVTSLLGERWVPVTQSRFVQGFPKISENLFNQT